MLVNGDKAVEYLLARVRLQGETDGVGGRFADGFVFSNGKITRYLTSWERVDALEWAGIEVHPPRHMRIEIDDLSRPQVHALLEEHLANMYELSPPEQVFALDLTKLRVPEITFWTVWDQDELIGCGALKELSPTHGEIKSMRTPAAARGRGAGRAVLAHIISVAERRGYLKLSLETGTHPAFEPAHNLYRSQGFVVSGPFGSYSRNPHSVFMELQLSGNAASRETRADA